MDPTVGGIARDAKQLGQGDASVAVEDLLPLDRARSLVPEPVRGDPVDFHGQGRPFETPQGQRHEPASVGTAPARSSNGPMRRPIARSTPSGLGAAEASTPLKGNGTPSMR